MNLYLVLISRKGGYVVHSIHNSRESAESWAKCKEADGEDTTIAEIATSLIVDAGYEKVN